MSILQQPPFNPTSLFTQFGVTDEAVAGEVAAISEFIKPENQQARKEQRQQELDQLSGELNGIIEFIREECRQEKLAPDFEEVDGVIIFLPKKYRDCSGCIDNDCLIEHSGSGEVVSGLLDRIDYLEAKEEFDDFEPQSVELPSFEQFNEQIILKHRDMISDWGNHVVQNSIILGPTIPFGLVNPLIIAPSVAEETARNVYNSRIKPYNKEHANYLDALTQSFTDYSKPENIQQRYEERIARRPEVSGEIDQLREEIATAENELIQVEEVDNGDIILIGDKIPDSPSDPDDPARFTQGSISRITDYIQTIREHGQLLRSSYDFLQEPVDLYLTTIRQEVELRIKEKQIKLSELESDRVTANNLLEDAKNSVTQQESTILAVFLSLIQELLNQYERWFTITLPIMEDSGAAFTNSFYNAIEFVATSQQYISSQASLRQSLSAYIEFSEEDSLAKIVSLTEEYVMEKLAGVYTSSYQTDSSIYEIQKAFLAASTEILNRVNQINASSSGSNQSGISIVPYQTMVQNINRFEFVLTIADNYNAYREYVETRYDEIKARINNASTDSERSKIIEDFDAEYDEDFKTAVNLFDSLIDSSTASEKIQFFNNTEQERKTITDNVSELHNNFEFQKTERERVRTDYISGLESELTDIDSSIVEAQNLPDDDEKVHSYSLLLLVVDRLRSRFNSIKIAIEEHENSNQALLAERDELQASLNENNDVLLPQDIQRINDRIDEINQIISSYQPPQLQIFEMAHNNLLVEIIQSIQPGLQDKKDRLAKLEDEYENPEKDEAFPIPTDPYDELKNATRAIVYAFMTHLVTYGVVLVTNVFGVTTAGFFSPTIISTSVVNETADAIYSELNSPGPNGAADLVPTIVRKIVNGLFFRCSLHLATYATIESPLGTARVF